MKAVHEGKEFEFEIRPGTTDANLIKHIWTEDCYRIKSLAKEHPEISTVLEIGGHIGVFTVLASILWPGAEIRTYEAWIENYILLDKHCRPLDNVRIFNMAVLGWREELATFKLPNRGQGNTGDGRIDNKYMPNAHFVFGDTLVPARSIEEVLVDYGRPDIDLLKLDCEGSEIPILESLEETGFLPKIRWIRGEWHGGDANRDRVKTLLSKTHEIELQKTKNTYGLFWAEKR